MIFQILFLRALIRQLSRFVEESIFNPTGILLIWLIFINFTTNQTQLPHEKSIFLLNSQPNCSLSVLKNYRDR